MRASEAALLMVVLNYVTIYLLPFFFFRRTGWPGWRWWVTALPFHGCPAYLVWAHLTGARPITPAAWSTPLTLASVALTTGSFMLLFRTLGTHRTPPALFHQNDDAPESIVTHGPYRRVRHPMYASYLLLFLASLALFPSWVVLGAFGYAAAGLNHAARTEERRLCASQFGAEYQAYLARTGRFLPPLQHPSRKRRRAPRPVAPAGWRQERRAWRNGGRGDRPGIISGGQSA